MKWDELSPVALAEERALREKGGASAARAAPAMAREESLEVAGMTALRCVPRACKSDVPHVFVHGGGWVVGSSVNSLGLVRRVAAQAQRPVISLDYPLAPEHPYPRAIESVAAALQDIERSQGLAGGIAGSAGAQILVHAASRADTLKGLRGAVLFCGAYGWTLDSWSNKAFGDTPDQLTTQDMRAFLEAYALPEDVALPDVALLPPMYLSVGDQDPLLVDTLDLYAATRGRNGCTLNVVPGGTHGFMNDWYRNPGIDRALQDAVDWLERICVPGSQAV